MSSLRASFYRGFQNHVVQRWLLPRWVSNDRLVAGEAGRLGVRARVAGKRRAWFHAASVGELESLVPVVEAWVARGDEALVTVLSESAQRQVERLKMTAGDLIISAGYSPWEGHWGEALGEAVPDIFVTAKYEAWPELWLSLAERGIPLVIVSCRSRRSLKLARAVCRMLGGKLPRLALLPVHEEDARALRELFPQARVEPAGEPRWDRVQARAQAGNPRAASLIRAFGAWPRPWGVLGSVWPSDLEIWKACIAELGEWSGMGTLWVVPHKTDDASLRDIERMLQELGIRPVHTRELKEGGSAPPPSGACILVDEMGVLSELYSAADWAFVGGGFGSGPKGTTIHSTIEPALYGIPVSGGPHGAGKFAEVAELERCGQLRLVNGAEKLREWLVAVLGEDREARARKSEGWKAEVRRRLGAPERILRVMDDVMAQIRAAC